MSNKQKSKLEIARIRIAKHLIKEYKLHIESRSRPIVYQRYYLYHELRKSCTLHEIADLFNKDHASVMHGIKMHQAWTSIKDKEYLKMIATIKEDFETQMLEGFSKGDELRISLEDIFQDVASLNIKMKVNKEFIEKLPDIKTFQHLHDLYLEHIE
jgi:hypothetical protein